MILYTDGLPYQAMQQGLITTSEVLFIQNINQKAEKDINSVSLLERRKRKDILKRINSNIKSNLSRQV